MADTITVQGNPMTLSGPVPKEGEMLPDCTVLDRDFQPQKLSSFRGKVLIIISLPSLDTPVCTKEAKTFDFKICSLGDNAACISVSMDSPFAQARWCSVEDVKKLKVFSDFKDREFGDKLGLRVNELGILARAVFVCDPMGKIYYREVVSEVSSEPDYEKAQQKAEELLAALKT